MTVRYIVDSPRHLVQYVATNLLPKGYLFWNSFALPPPGECDLHAIDLKILLKYDAHLSKSQRCRRQKSGRASVKYVRCGNVGYLFATRGSSPFFHCEPWRDARQNPVCIAGHSIRALPDGTVSVRIHREAQRRLKLHLVENARLPARELEDLFWNLPFLAFKGIQDNMSAAVKFANGCRKTLRLPPVDWRRCVRKKIKVEPVFLPTPPEVADLLSWWAKRR